MTNMTNLFIKIYYKILSLPSLLSLKVRILYKKILLSAEKICKALGVDFNKYFNIKIDRHPYAKETVMKFKRTLATILASAKRQRLVMHNFASRDYSTPILGRNILAIDGQKLIDYSAQKMEQIYPLGYSECGYKKHWQRLTCQK